MNLLALTVGHQQGLLVYLIGIIGIAALLRYWRPEERRSVGLGLALLVLGILALAFAAMASGNPDLENEAVGAALVLAGLGTVQVAMALFFRGFLPMTGVAVPRIAQDLATVAFMLAWLLACLRMAGMQPAQLFTTSALVTAVVAFAMQDTLGNILGGVVVQLDNSLRVGDWVRFDDVNGRVTDVRWRYTTVETRNRELVIVPNSVLMKKSFFVVRPPVDGGHIAWRRAVVLQVDALEEPSAVIETLEKSVMDADIPNVLTHPAPSAILTEVGPGFFRYTLRYWLAEPQFDDPSDSRVRVHALAGLARAGFRLGLPQEERLTIKEDETWRLAAQEKERARRLNAIRCTDLFSKLPADEQQMLAEHLVHAPFAEGDTMTRQGAVAHWLYLIVNGSARVHIDTPSGRLELATLGPGSVFGELGMLTGEPRSATVVAATAVNCYRLDKIGFAKVLELRPEIAKEISSIMEQRMAQRQAFLEKAGGGRVVQGGDMLERILSFFSQQK